MYLQKVKKTQEVFHKFTQVLTENYLDRPIFGRVNLSIIPARLSIAFYKHISTRNTELYLKKF